MRLALVLAASIPAAAAAGQTGPVTPTAATFHFTEVDLQVADQVNQVRNLTKTPFSYTFRRSDPDFAAEALQDVEIPFGRYAALSICFDSHVDLVLDGVRYDGPSGTKYRTGDLVHEAPSSVGVSAQAIECRAYDFPAPLCITDDPKGDCRAGDTVYDAGHLDGDAGTLRGDFSLNLLVDLYHSVWIDADSGAPKSVPSLQVTWGRPGAGIHLAAVRAGTTADVSILFGPDRSVLSASASKWPLSGGMNGMCVGQSDVQLHEATPSDGPRFISAFDPSGTGVLQVPATRQCTTAENCNSTGVNVITDLLQPIGAQAIVRCIPDADASPPFLGHSYVGGRGGDGTMVNLEISRVVDPDDLFGICTPSTAVAGHPGTCAAQHRDSDGYP